MNLINDATRPPWPWQEQIWRRLCRQQQSGVLAHAYLFCGDKGTGRTGFAREFANFLLCESPVAERACYQCRSCLAGGAEHHPDLLLAQPPEGRKDIGVDQIRELAEFLSRSSFSGQGRVALILQAERLTLSASNALLKTLEEPATSAYLLLAGISPGSLLPTIRSRCQLLPLPGPDADIAAAWLRQRLSGSEFDSSERMLELLEMFGNRPLALEQGLRSGQVSEFVSLRQLLLDLLEGRIGAQHAAKVAAKAGESAVFEHLARISTILIRGLVNGEWRGTENRQLAEALTEADSAASLGALLEFQRQVTKVRQQLSGPGNPNPQLLLESTFRSWTRQERPRES